MHTHSNAHSNTHTHTQQYTHTYTQTEGEGQAPVEEGQEGMESSEKPLMDAAELKKLDAVPAAQVCF